MPHLKQKLNEMYNEEEASKNNKKNEPKEKNVTMSLENVKCVAYTHQCRFGSDVFFAVLSLLLLFCDCSQDVV